MKKIIVVFMLSLLLTACRLSTTPSPATTVSSTSSSSTEQSTTAQSSADLSQMTYADYTAGLTPISYADLTEKMAKGDAFLIYLGRESCPHCQAFVPKLYVTLLDYPRTVYYYNTEDKADLELQAFREQYGIKTVPHLAYFEGEQQVAVLEQGSQASYDDLVALLTRLAD